MVRRLCEACTENARKRLGYIHEFTFFNAVASSVGALSQDLSEVKMASNTNDAKKHLNTLRLGLRALEILNERDALTVMELAKLLDIPKTNARRILDTLRADGYCEYIVHDHLYRLAPYVAKLSAGLSDEQWISYVSSALLVEKTKELGWPLLLTTLTNESILIRVSTDHITTRALQQHPVGLKMPITLTTSGLVALAFLPDHQQDSMLRKLSTLPNHSHRISGNLVSTKQLLAKIKVRGYAHRRYESWRIASMAVPVFMEGAFKACLRLGYIKSALTEKQALATFVPILKALAHEIGEQTDLMKKRILSVGYLERSALTAREERYSKLVTALGSPTWVTPSNR